MKVNLLQNKSHIIQFLAVIWLLWNSFLYCFALLQKQIKVSFYISFFYKEITLLFRLLKHP